MEHEGAWMTTKEYERIIEKKSRDKKDKADRAAWAKDTKEEAKRERMEQKEPLTRGSESEGSGLLRDRFRLLPSNPNSLLTILQYRVGSYQAGSHALRNEIVDIADELYRQKAINSVQYKHISKIIANPVKRKYVRRYVVGGAGIGDFLKKGWNKVTGLFRRAKPMLSRAIKSDVGKALTSAGKDLAVAGIGAAKDYAVSKIADKVANRANALAQAADELSDATEPPKKTSTSSQVANVLRNVTKEANLVTSSKRS